jgi:hypothetical protein
VTFCHSPVAPIHAKWKRRREYTNASGDGGRESGWSWAADVQAIVRVQCWGGIGITSEPLPMQESHTAVPFASSSQTTPSKLHCTTRIATAAGCHCRTAEQNVNWKPSSCTDTVTCLGDVVVVHTGGHVCTIKPRICCVAAEDPDLAGRQQLRLGRCMVPRLGQQL